MPKLLAIDWDAYEARYVLASTKGRQVSLLASGAVPLTDTDEEGADQAIPPGNALKAALAKKALSHATVLVGVPRSAVDLLHFEVPPATDPELPELVLNQVMREMPSYSEDDSLDFLPLDADAQQPRAINAAILPRTQRESLHEQCQLAGLKPDRLLLRSLASASLFLRSHSPSPQATFLVNAVGYEVDLNVVNGGRVLFSRTVRLSEQDADSDRIDRLISEVHRTLAVIPSDQLNDALVQRACVYGDQHEQEQLVQRLAEELAIPVQTIDPFAAVGAEESEIPPTRESFAPLLGMLLDQVQGAHAIDFLHPRQAPQPVNRLRIGGLAAAALLILIGYFAFDTWSQLSEIHRTNQKYSAALAKLNATAKKAETRVKVLKSVQGWKDRDINWLEELRDLSVRFPSSRDIVVLRMSMRMAAANTGAIDVQGLVRDPKVVVNMERQIRDPKRNVRSRSVRERGSAGDYTWSFETTMHLAARSKEEYLSAAATDVPAEEPSETDAEPQTETTEELPNASDETSGEEVDQP